MVEFVSYDGHYPHLCVGELVLRINGEEANLGTCLTSGGSVTFDEDYNECVVDGPWRVHVPKQYAQYTEEITSVVNRNIPWGCCGGCI